MRFKSAVVLLLIIVIGTTTFPVTGQEEPLPAIQAKGSIAPLTRSIVLPVEPIGNTLPTATLETAARANDFITFDALYRDAVQRGESVAAFAPLHELWTFSITDPVGAFYGPDIYDRLVRAYPGYARYIAEYRIVDSNNNVFYPTSETRAFLLDRALEGRAPNVQFVEGSGTPRSTQRSTTLEQSVWERSIAASPRSTAATPRSTAAPRRSTASQRSTAPSHRNTASSEHSSTPATSATQPATPRRRTSRKARTHAPAVATNTVSTPTNVAAASTNRNTAAPKASAAVTEKAPVVSEKAPDVVNTTPGVVGTTPGVVNTTPGAVDTTPVVVNTTPVVVGTTPVVSEKAPAVADPSTVTAEAPTVVRAEPAAVDTPVPAPRPIAVDSNFGGRGILLLVIGLIGVGLLAMMLRTPREVPTSIMQPPNTVPPTGDKPSGPTPVEPLRRPSAAPEPPPPGKNRAGGSHG